MAKTSRHRYEIVLYWSGEDQAYIAEVPELPGCAADGASYREALAAAEDVIEGWIETALEMGRKSPSPRSTAGCMPERWWPPPAYDSRSDPAQETHRRGRV